MMFYSKLNIRKIFGITAVITPFVIAAGPGIALQHRLSNLHSLLMVAWLFVTLGPYLLVARTKKDYG
jgi:hypothetical protein